MTDTLDVERLFSEPDLNGRVPTALRFSPDVSRVTWLMAAEDNLDVLDLWEYDIERKESRPLVEAASLTRPGRGLSDEEKANRERKRIFRSGITEYHWHPDGTRLLFPLDGCLYLYNLPAGNLAQLTSDTTFETNVAFSADGRYLSFIRSRNLFLKHLDDGVEIQITHDGGGTVSNGLAEFIAQEEMHRYDGYWWSPDSRRIAFLQVDESTVDLTQRYEIDADGMRVFDQRYPFAGTPNARVRLGIADVGGAISWIEIQRDPESYVARVSWLADSRRLAVQVQDRGQQRLDLVIIDIETGEQKVVVTETSKTWINLNDNFRSLKEIDEFLWGSERTGFNHLYRIDGSGKLQTQISAAEGPVCDVKGVDEKSGLVYFDGYLDTPLERHLYVASISDETPPARITQAGSSHEVELSSDCRFFLDRSSSADTPVSVSLRRITGDALQSISSNELDRSHPMSPYIAIGGDASFGHLEAEDGQKLWYRLIRPTLDGGQRFPVIVTVYGGPGVQRVTNEWIPPWNRYMASRGYGLLQLDNRGSTNRGTAFEAPIYHSMGVAEVADQLTGVNFLKSLDWVDPERLGVFGHSYGGYMTLMLLMKAPGVFRCGVSVAPVTDWRLYDTHYTERYLGDPATNPEVYTQSSVFPWVANLQDRLLMIHGMADDNVLYTHSTRLYSVLQDAGVQFEMMAYPGAKHGIAGRQTNIHRYTLMDRFFDQYLKEA